MQILARITPRALLLPALALACALASAARAATPADTDTVARASRNLIIFVADGLRRGSVNAQDTPALYSMRSRGVDFPNSHSLFPTLTTANASAIATGHHLGDTGDFANALYFGYPIFDDLGSPGSLTPFLESNQVLADVDRHASGGNYLNEETLLALARSRGYLTAAVGKMGPVAIQDVTQLAIDRERRLQPTVTLVIDDDTGTAASPPLPPSVQSALAAAGLPPAPPRRTQPTGSAIARGTLEANSGQQSYFADAVTEAILPAFAKGGRPFVLLYWSRDPDGSQHNEGDSFDSATGLADRLTPGINGPTARAGVKDADANLAQILAFLDKNPELSANTDVFVTSDHGFATVSKHEIDAAGHASRSYSSGFRYRTAAGEVDVVPGFLPPGFLAIDLAHALHLPLFDPDSQVLIDGRRQYEPIDPTIARPSATRAQRPMQGNGVLGGNGAILRSPKPRALVAANGGADLIYVPAHDRQTVRAMVAFLAQQDYVGGLFVDSRYGSLPGALPLSAIDLEGSSIGVRPDLVVSFRSFALDAANPIDSAVQVADTTLQEGQGTHGGLARDSTLNNMAAMGPDFKRGFEDRAPVSNADIASTLAQVLGLPLPRHGALPGRVLDEALLGGPNPAPTRVQVALSAKTAARRATLLEYQTFEHHRYLDRACFEPVSSSVSRCDGSGGDAGAPRPARAADRRARLDFPRVRRARQ